MGIMPICLFRGIELIHRISPFLARHPPGPHFQSVLCCQAPSGPQRSVPLDNVVAHVRLDLFGAALADETANIHELLQDYLPGHETVQHVE